MKMPQAGAAPQQFTLRNSSGKDIAFEGFKLAEVDNFNPNAFDKETGQRSGSSRWKERAVYLTKGGNVVCHKLGRSNMKGEVDRGEVLVIHKPSASANQSSSAGSFSPVDAGTAIAAAALEVQRRGQAKASAASETWADAAIVDFFQGDALAKDLLDMLGIADVERID